MSRLQDVCTALANQIRTQIAGGIQVNVYPIPVADPKYPYVMIRPGTPFADYSKSFSNGPRTDYNVVLEVSASGRADDSYRQCYNLVDVGFGTTSVPDAAMLVNSATGKPDIGGVVSSVYVSTADEVTQPADMNAVFRIAVQIVTSRSTT